MRSILLQRPAARPAFRLLVISDPQIPDHRSYPGRPLLLQWLGQAVIDNYLRKAYRLIASRHHPHAVIFNGDLLDSGHQASDRLEHAHYADRFKSIFRAASSYAPSLYFAGNHDTGLGLPPAQAAHAREQFRDEFGPLHGQRSLGNHSIIWIDSMALLEERASDDIGAPLDKVNLDDEDSEFAFVRKASIASTQEPRLLFTHIPLWRPPDTDCGSVREASKALNQGRGRNYQNLMDEDISRWILEKLQPEAVFSGDDHDACVVSHPHPQAQTLPSITEHTVRSLSMAMGVAHPGYELVSLYESSQPPSYDAKSCTLPYQVGIYTGWYLPCLILTVLFVALPKIRMALSRTEHRSRGLPIHHRTPSYLDYAREAMATISDGEEDHDNGYLSSPVGPQYSYHHGATEDDLPTPAYTPLTKSKRPSTAKVRRVSRVFLWDGTHEGRDPLINAPPAVRMIRRMVMSIVARPLSTLAKRLFYNEPMQEIWSAVWPALALSVTIYAWYS